MNRTVYVIQEPSSSRDFSSALKYGRLEFILSPHEKVGMLPARSLSFLRTKLKNFKNDDYVVWAGGDPFAPILAGLVLGEMAFKEINYLRWERDKTKEGVRGTTGYYIPGKLILRHITEVKDLNF